MIVANREDVRKVMSENNIQTCQLGDFEIPVDVNNLAEIVHELGYHTAFKLCHDNETIEQGFADGGLTNYELQLEDGVLKGKCYTSAPGVTVTHLVVK